MPARVLVLGVPRSGTTWVGRTLGATAGAVYVHEPDGDHDPFAFRARLGHPAVPVLAPGAPAPDATALWTGAFAGGRPAGTTRDRVARWLYAGVPIADRWRAWRGDGVSPRLRAVAALGVPLRAAPAARHVVVKSVRAEFITDWLVAAFDPVVLVVERHPLNVLASWIELDFFRDLRGARLVARQARRWRVDPPPDDAPRLVHQAFQFGVVATALREAVEQHPEWVVARHEDLCVDSVGRFRMLSARLGLEWSDSARGYLEASDRAGAGYSTQRPAQEMPERWRSRLDDAQVATIRRTLDAFPYALVPDG